MQVKRMLFKTGVLGRGWSSSDYRVRVYAMLCVVLGLANAGLLLQNYALRRALRPATGELLEVGDRVPGFTAPLVGGGTIDVAFGEESSRRTTVLAFLRTSCAFCLRQAPLWAQLADRIDRELFRVLVVAPDSEDEDQLAVYADETGYGNVPVALIPFAAGLQYKLSVTPLTLVIDPDGVVVAVWPGLWTNSVTETASEVLGVSFDASESPW